MRRAPLILALSFACGLSSLACKQDLNERCEQHSDCASGYCRGAGTTSAMGGTCQTGPSTPDASTPIDATTTDAPRDVASDASDAADATSSDAPQTDATTDVPVGAPDAAGDALGDADDATGG
jgi:hypothetical protein